jgi:glycosyltransferase involved in cell wall biosynthesis
MNKKSKKLNILYLIDHYHAVGGTETHLARLVTSMDKERFQCTIIAFDFGHNYLVDLVRESGHDFLHISVGKYYTYNAFRKALEISRIIKEKNIDIVQTFHIKSDFYGTLVARMAGVKIFVSSKRDIGDLKSSWHFFLNKLIRSIPARFIVPADAVGKVVVEKEGVDPEKVITIYNGVDSLKFRRPSPAERSQARSALGIDVDDFVIGTVAWLRPEKNYDILFEALVKALRVSAKLKVIAVGGGEDGGAHNTFLKDYAKKLGIADNVVFIGQVTDVRPWLRTFDVACLVPGGNEGFSNAIIEKMALGLPLVVTDVGGNAEAVIDGFNGIVIPPDDADKLAEALIYLLEHPEDRGKMGERSAQRVKEMFTLERMVKMHEDLYETVMSENGR